MEQVRLCTVWPQENWLGTSRTTQRGWMNDLNMLLSCFGTKMSGSRSSSSSPTARAGTFSSRATRGRCSSSRPMGWPRLGKSSWFREKEANWKVLLSKKSHFVHRHGHAVTSIGGSPPSHRDRKSGPLPRTYLGETPMNSQAWAGNLRWGGRLLRRFLQCCPSETHPLGPVRYTWQTVHLKVFCKCLPI